MIQWIPITEYSQLQTMEEASASLPVLLFKHSTRCSISSAARNRLERNWYQALDTKIKTYFLDLIAYRTISDEIAARYAIEHQSPQVMLLVNSKCIYSETHSAIRLDEITKFIDYRLHVTEFGG